MYLGYIPQIRSRVLARLVLKHMQAFSDCLWRGIYDPFDKKLIFSISNAC